jgi:probable rRNA maturation factor
MALERDASVLLRFVDGPEGRALNRTYRGKDYATNVLTFVYDQQALSGDIVLCRPVIEREAAELSRSFDARCAHLVLHGVLHLLGYDHERAADAKRMEARERLLLARLGIADPYE